MISTVYQKLLRATALVLVLLILVVSRASESFVVSAQPAQATPSACTHLLDLVQKSLKSSCSALDRDQICFGNDAISVKFKDQAAGVKFAKVGDVAPISSIASLTTAPLDLDSGKWGLAVLKIQANVPNTTANQAVTFVVYGNTTLTNSTTSVGKGSGGGAACNATTNRVISLVDRPDSKTGLQRMSAGTALVIHGRSADSKWVLADIAGMVGWVNAQAVTPSCDLNTMPQVDPSLPDIMPSLRALYFSADVSAQASCQDVPSGLLVKSQSGRNVSFNVNGADLTIGSSVMLRASPKKSMNVRVIQGHATVQTGGVSKTLTSKEELDVPLGGADGLEADGPPSDPTDIPANDPTITDACDLAQASGSSDACNAPEVVPPDCQNDPASCATDEPGVTPEAVASEPANEPVATEEAAAAATESVEPTNAEPTSVDDTAANTPEPAVNDTPAPDTSNPSDSGQPASGGDTSGGGSSSGDSSNP